MCHLHIVYLFIHCPPEIFKGGMNWRLQSYKDIPFIFLYLFICIFSQVTIYIYNFFKCYVINKTFWGWISGKIKYSNHDMGLHVNKTEPWCVLFYSSRSAHLIKLIQSCAFLAGRPHYLCLPWQGTPWPPWACRHVTHAANRGCCWPHDSGEA